MKFYFLVLLLLGASPALAAIYVVDLDHGSDVGAGTAGAPFKTTARAIELAQAGDTVQIVHRAEPIRETLVINEKSGDVGYPITIDGGGNLFTGADPLNPADWTEVRPGVFRNDHLVKYLKKVKPNANDDIIRRFFFLFDGKQQRMGRSSKGNRRPLPSLDTLQPGQWTYVDSETAFYVAIEPGKTLSDAHIEAPVRCNGVAITGTCNHWVIRNLNTTHVYNDGFNIHGHTEDFLYQDITSTECGDDGFSQHQESQCTIRNFVSRHNSTGIANLGSGTYDHVDLEDNYGENLLILGAGTHEFRNSIISATAPPDGWGGIAIDGDPKYGSPIVRFIDCKIPWPTTPNPSGKPALWISPKPDSAKVEILGTTHLDGKINVK